MAHFASVKGDDEEAVGNPCDPEFRVGVRVRVRVDRGVRVSVRVRVDRGVRVRVDRGVRVGVRVRVDRGVRVRVDRGVRVGRDRRAVAPPDPLSR